MLRGSAQRMGVLTNIDRALNVLSYPVIDDGLSDCEDMPLIEGGG